MIGGWHRIGARLTAVVLAGWCACASSAGAQPDHGLGAFAGIWKINRERSSLGRAGPTGVQTRRSATFTWVFTPEGAGLRMEIYAEYPAPAPTKVLHLVPDGRQHPCAMQESCLSSPGDPKEQSYAFTRMDGHMGVRVFQVRGQSVEYNVYAVSVDGTTFVATSWSPQTPEYRNVQVFERQP
jgi:hypothetical protein